MAPDLHPEDAEAYRVLGVAPGTPPGEVARVYRRLALRHHPDRIDPGDPAARAAAEARMRELNRAWARLRRAEPVRRTQRADRRGQERDGRVARDRPRGPRTGGAPLLGDAELAAVTRLLAGQPPLFAGDAGGVVNLVLDGAPEGACQRLHEGFLAGRWVLARGHPRRAVASALVPYAEYAERFAPGAPVTDAVGFFAVVLDPFRRAAPGSRLPGLLAGAAPSVVRALVDEVRDVVAAA